jgi:hypothetical protein
MKTLALITLVGVGIGGWVIWNESNVTEFIIERHVEEKVVEVLPEWASNEQAVKAAQDVIRKQELEATLKSLESEKAIIDARIAEVRAELKTY